MIRTLFLGSRAIDALKQRVHSGIEQWSSDWCYCSLDKTRTKVEKNSNYKVNETTFGVNQEYCISIHGFDDNYFVTNCLGQSAIEKDEIFFELKSTAFDALKLTLLKMVFPETEECLKNTKNDCFINDQKIEPSDNNICFLLYIGSEPLAVTIYGRSMRLSKLLDSEKENKGQKDVAIDVANIKSSVTGDVYIRFGGFPITDVLKLSPGDVLVSSNKLENKFELAINKTKIATVAIGTYSSEYSLKIVGA